MIIIYSTFEALHQRALSHEWAVRSQPARQSVSSSGQEVIVLSRPRVVVHLKGLILDFHQLRRLLSWCK